jgi:hypothetical protein
VLEILNKKRKLTVEMMRSLRKFSTRSFLKPLGLTANARRGKNDSPEKMDRPLVLLAAFADINIAKDRSEYSIVNGSRQTEIFPKIPTRSLLVNSVPCPRFWSY